MNEFICPFCGQTIVCTDAQDADEYSTWFCPWCVAERNWCAFGNKTLWQELIRTRKALDVAVDALKSAHDYYEYCIQRDKDYGSDDINWDCTAMNMDNDISEAIDKITATLENQNGNC